MKRTIILNLSSLATTLLVSLAVSGCDRDSVKVYQVDSKDTTPPPQPASAAASMASMAGDIPAPDNSNLPKLKYEMPAGWQEKPATQFRVASFEVLVDGKKLDVSVIPLGGSSGGDLANVNRWRSQAGLTAIDESALKQSVESIEIAGTPADLYDIAAPPSDEATSVLGAILHGSDTVWYFKMIGDADLVKSQKTNFIAFLKSVSFGQPAATAMMDMSQLPPSHPPISGMGSQTETAADATATPTWTVPAGWQPGELAQFLTARFVIKGEGDASATVNVSQLSGDGGGLAANVNRWRKQLGQPPVADEEIAKLPTIDASGTKAVVAEITGTDARTGKPASLVGAVIPLNGQTWFYKLMGDAQVVSAQKDVFLQFVQSAKYPAGQ